jgi:hypothetical protein
VIISRLRVTSSWTIAIKMNKNYKTVFSSKKVLLTAISRACMDAVAMGMLRVPFLAQPTVPEDLWFCSDRIHSAPYDERFVASSNNNLSSHTDDPHPNYEPSQSATHILGAIFSANLTMASSATFAFAPSGCTSSPSTPIHT